MRPIVLLAPLLLGALAACAGQGTSSPLTNTTWRFVSIDDAPPVAGQRARIRFDRGSLGANVGCNSIAGPWRIDSQRLIAGPLAQTEMFCEGPVWGDEQAVAALLAGGPRLFLRGDRLRLESAGHRAELRRVARGSVEEGVSPQQ